jgi:hypothetical protein
MLSSSVIPDTNATSAQFTILYVSPTVRDVQNQDGAVLLDLHQGICFGLTPVGMKIWELLKAKTSLDQICDCLCREYADANRERIAQDTTQFVRELLAIRLISSDRSEPKAVSLPRFLGFIQRRMSAIKKGEPRQPRFLFCKALLCLAAFDLFRFGGNFSRIYEFVRGWRVSAGSGPDDVTDQVCNAVNFACVWYPKRVLCLQRSVVTTCLLRHYSIPAQMVMGARRFPFKAHAWTEVNGRPVNERRDVQRLYLVWERC